MWRGTEIHLLCLITSFLLWPFVVYELQTIFKIEIYESVPKAFGDADIQGLLSSSHQKNTPAIQTTGAVTYYSDFGWRLDLYMWNLMSANMQLDWRSQEFIFPTEMYPHCKCIILIEISFHLKWNPLSVSFHFNYCNCAWSLEFN